MRKISFCGLGWAVLMGFVFLCGVASARAGDWVTYGGDAGASFFVKEGVAASPKLRWEYSAAQAPVPAFRNGHAEEHLEEPIIHDYAFQPIVAGGKLFYGSSAENAVICLDTKTGGEDWIFFANGPVRIAPIFSEGQIFFGSEDGFVYCLEAVTGKLNWKFMAAPTIRVASLLERPGSAWPVTAGPVLHEGILYCAAGFFPPQGSYLYALDAATGTKKWEQKINYAPRGQIVISGNTLWMPTGRTVPAEFALADGTPRLEDPALRRAYGGSFVSVLTGNMVTWGPNEWGLCAVRFGDKDLPVNRSYAKGVASGTMTLTEARTVVSDGDTLFFVRKKEIWAVGKDAWIEAARASIGDGADAGARRFIAGRGATQFNPLGITAGGQDMAEDDGMVENLRNGKLKWSVPNDFVAEAALLAGKQVILGGKDKVAILDADTGKLSWSAPVEGEARGLAAADGVLYVSTTLGKIYCFDQAGGNAKTSPAAEAGSQVAFTAAEKAIVQALGERKKGWCFVVGFTSAASAVEQICRLSSNTEFLIIGVERDALKVAEVRSRLRKLGLYGSRAVVWEESSDKLNFARGLGNVVICNDTTLYKSESFLSLVQPYGGLLAVSAEISLGSYAENFLPWQKADVMSITRRGLVPDAGEWTHVYANPGATAASNDKLISADLELQWVGPPGPKDSPNRHNLAQTSLWKNAKLFYPTLDQSIIAIDGYNGTELWRFAAPLSVRQMMSHNAGGTCVTDGKLFVASETGCVEVNTETGLPVHTYPVPTAGLAWGYSAVVGDILIGSTQSAEAARAAAVKPENTLVVFFSNSGEYRSNPLLTRHLFAINHATRKPLWDYKHDTIIMHTSLAASSDTLFFAESKNAAAALGETGLLDPTAFFKDAALVALDLATGKEKWRTALPSLTSEAEMLLYLATAQDVLVSYRSYYKNDVLSYEVLARDCATGKTLWTQAVFNTEAGAVKPLKSGKNAFSAHPVIMAGKVHVLPFFLVGTLCTYDLKTGEAEKDTSFSRNWQNKGCTPPTGADKFLFYRNTSVYMFDVEKHKEYDLSRVTRPACWLSVIPAGGLVTSPELSAFCTCGNAYQISFALAPAEK